jgi:hypothetical protein
MVAKMAKFLYNCNITQVNHSFLPNCEFSTMFHPRYIGIRLVKSSYICVTYVYVMLYCSVDPVIVLSKCSMVGSKEYYTYIVSDPVEGTVSGDFSPLLFPYKKTSRPPLIDALKLLRICIRFDDIFDFNNGSSLWPHRQAWLSGVGQGIKPPPPPPVPPQRGPRHISAL